MDPRLLATFHEIESEHWWFRARRALLLELLRHRLAPGARLLDIGCGTGFFLEAAAQSYAVAGVDASADAVAFCRARGLREIHQGTAEALPDLGREAWDAVCLLDVIEHLDDDVLALRRAADLLRPGGLVLVTVPAYQWMWSPHDEVNHHRRRYTRRQLVDALGRAGLHPQWASYFNAHLFPAAVMARAVQRLLARRHSGRLATPPAPVNRALERIFRAERGRLAGPAPRGYPFGLSVVAVATRPN